MMPTITTVQGLLDTPFREDRSDTIDIAGHESNDADPVRDGLIRRAATESISLPTVARRRQSSPRQL